MATEKEIRELQRQLHQIKQKKKLESQKKELQQQINAENESDIRKVAKSLWKRFLK